MERYKITLFIFGTIAILAALCAVFPEEGISVGGFGMRFPSLHEVLTDGAEEEAAPSPEEILEERRRSAQRVRKGELEEFFMTDPARFILPDGDLSFFDDFFAELEDAENGRVNIVHYGDSQLEEDRITSRFRENLQERFGGGGVGILPAKTYYTIRESVASSRALPYRMVYGDESLRAGHSRYGPMGQFTETDSLLIVSVRPARNVDSPSNRFNRISIYTSGGMSASCKGVRKSIPAGLAMNCTSFELPDSTTKATVSISGSGSVYGISLYDYHGVTVDNIPMRGCSGTIFTAINSSQLRDYYQDSNTRLIILQYGGNAVPYIKGGKAISNYCNSIRKQIAYLHEQAPGASIVFIGPSDMATSINGKRQTYPHLPAYIDSLKAGVNEAGAAYWDMYSAMGGEGSMVSWVNAQPPLAGPDYIHFTRLGANKAADILTDALMLYYDYYKLRKDED